MNPVPLCLVSNPALFADRPDAFERQSVAWDSVRKYRPAWCVTRRACTYNDFKHLDGKLNSLYCLKRDSNEIAGTTLHLPFVRELMKIAGYPLSLREDKISGRDHWRGILNNDTVIGPQFFSYFQTVDDDVNCIFVRAWDVDALPERADETPKDAKPRTNYNSLEGLFLRGEAVDVFEETYPDVIFGWAWDEAAVLWGTNTDSVVIKPIDHPRAALHVRHTSPARLTKHSEYDKDLGDYKTVDEYNGPVLQKFFESLP